ncbi:hypothetical protein NLG97_g4392 [Lecanicillium saksenae]|uniref:Uncharacterized protein n=1 Tax=Lecanicillium saksenae TaxID=468837 RepID=A0ACC1QVE8_9HYPO|nr:hypothetical protein NLG97_g4392 [Lecanicillium saksenae]
MCLMLTEGLQRHFPEAKQQHGKVTQAVLDKSTRVWAVSLDNHEPVASKRLVLCSGSRPIDTIPPNLRNNTGSQLANLDLDTALKPTLLAKTLDPNTPATIGVVGASHSAILVLLNLYNLAATSHPHLRIKWFSRHKELRYAKPMDGWILYDNTGLKGDAAQWARENLEEATFHASPASQVITKLFTGTGPGEQQVYQDQLPQCTHLVQAIGYQRDPLPLLSAVERAESEPLTLPINHDGISGRFFATQDQDSGSASFIPGLFGAGIAFPERVTDPAGNVEHAVGFWKFMRFLQRVVPQWVEKP